MFSGIICVEACLFVVSSCYAYNEILKQCEMLPTAIYKQGIHQNRNIKACKRGNP